MTTDSSAAAHTVRAKTIQVSVQAGAAREFPISVFPGCFVEYSFYTKGGDIGFGILLEKEDGTLKPVLENERVNAHEEAITGKIKCTQSGTLWFQWDNTHSWFTSKELVYSVTRQPTDGNSVVEHSGKSEINDSVSSQTSVDTNEVISAPVVNGAVKSNPLSPSNGVAATGATSSSPIPKRDNGNKRPVKIILGTMTMGSQVDPKTSVQMLTKFSNFSKQYLSGTSIEADTALMYNKGRTEILLGEIFASNVELRKEFALATKANPFKGYGNNLRPENLISQLQNSLDHLQCSSVDLFYLHAPDHETDITVTLKAVNDLYLTGKFRRFGLSNYAAWEVMEIYYLCDKNDWIKPSVYQGMYNAITREVEKELFPCLRRLGMSFYAYNPLAGGILSGRYTSNESANPMEIVPPDGRFGLAGMGSMYRARYWKPEVFEAVSRVQQVAEKHHLTLAEASLRWLSWHSELRGNSHDGVIIGVSKMDHLNSNLASFTNSADSGALPEELVSAFNDAWSTTKANCPSYSR